MPFTIKCATFARLANVALTPDRPDNAIPHYPALRSVRIETFQGKQYVIATNRLCMAIEYVGDVPGAPDEAVNVSLDLVAPCVEGAKFDGTLTVMADPNTGWAVATTSAGYFYPGNASVVGDWPRWRDVIPKSLPKKSEGAIAFYSSELKLLADASPSGYIVLPATYDAQHAIIVRDLTDPNWCGVFLALDFRSQSFKPATLPEWF